MKHETSRKLGYLSGFFGSVLMSVGLIVTAFAYRNGQFHTSALGTSAEQYSIWNHFVSELGHTQESELHLLFSISLIVGAIGFFLLMVGVGWEFDNAWRWFTVIGGLVVGFFGFMVAILPMDTQPIAHGIVAITFFITAWLVTMIFSIYIARSNQTAYRKELWIAGIPVTVSAVTFLLMLAITQGAPLFVSPEQRDSFTILAASEWAVIIFMLAWGIIMAANLFSKASPNA